VEESKDYISLYNKDNKLIRTYTGTNLAGETVKVTGDTIRIRLTTDEKGTAYGFKVDSVVSTGSESVSGNGTEQGNGNDYDSDDDDDDDDDDDPEYGGAGTNVSTGNQGVGTNVPTGNQSVGTGTVANASQNSVQLVTKLSITGVSKKVVAGKKIQLTAVVTPADAANSAVTWTSSNTKYATVSDTGKVTVKKAGVGKTVTITATAADGSGQKADYKIKIMKNAVTKVTVKASKKTVKAGKSLKLKASVKTNGKSVNKTLKWSSSNTKYATVSSKGVVKAKKAGKGKTVKITAMATDGSGKKSTVSIKIQ
jgi:uncharacterized protein YjdB